MNTTTCAMLTRWLYTGVSALKYRMYIFLNLRLTFYRGFAGTAVNTQQSCVRWQVPPPTCQSCWHGQWPVLRMAWAESSGGTCPVSNYKAMMKVYKVGKNKEKMKWGFKFFSLVRWVYYSKRSTHVCIEKDHIFPEGQLDQVLLTRKNLFSFPFLSVYFIFVERALMDSSYKRMTLGGLIVLRPQIQPTPQFWSWTNRSKSS